MVDAGELLLRLVLGGYMVLWGGIRLFGWYSGPGLAVETERMAALGFRAPRLWTLVSGLAQLAGGALAAIGFLWPAGPVLVAVTMAVAAAIPHGRGGLLTARRGFELPLLYASIAAALALSGPGRPSLDALLGIRLPSPAAGGVLAAAALAGAGLAVWTRSSTGPAPAAGAAPTPSERS